jgi:hypothetical protein
MSISTPPPIVWQDQDFDGNAVGTPEIAIGRLLGRRRETRPFATSDSSIAPFPEISFESSTPVQPSAMLSFVQPGYVQTSLGTLEFGQFRYTYVASNGVTQPSAPAVVGAFEVKSVERLFAAAREERFEDGLYSKFGRDLERVLDSSGVPAIFEAEVLIHNPLTSPSVAAEALRVLGSWTGSAPTPSRRRVIEGGLTHRSEVVRDAAAVALAALGDKAAVSALVVACQIEAMPGLRSDMQHVINELEAG